MSKSLIYILIPFVVIILIVIYYPLSAQVKINLKTFDGILPVEKGHSGLRSVLRLSKPVIIILPDQEIRLPKKTIISDEYEFGKIILPPDYACSIKAGNHIIDIPKGGTFTLGKGGVTEAEVNAELEIAGRKIPFTSKQGIGNYVSFYSESEGSVIKEGYLEKDIFWNLNGSKINLHNYRKSDLGYISYGFEGNIAFYPNGKLKAAFLKDKTSFIVGKEAIIANPGFITFHKNETVKSCTLANDQQFSTAKYSFTIPQGETVYFNPQGELGSEEQKLIRVKHLNSVQYPEIRKAEISLENKGVFLNQLKTDQGLSLDVCVNLPKMQYCNPMTFKAVKEEDFDVSMRNGEKLWFGYLAAETPATIGNLRVVLQKGSLIRFHDNQIIEEAVLAKEVVITHQSKKYKFLPGARLEFFDDGEIHYNSFEYQNKAQHKVISLN